MADSVWYHRLGWAVWLNLLAVAVCGWLAGQHQANGVASALVCVLASLVYGWLGVAGVRRKAGEGYIVLAVALVVVNWLGFALLDWWLA